MGIDKKFKSCTPFLILSSVFLVTGTAASRTVAPCTTQPLFVIERSKNANKVYYEARLTGDGVLDVHRPVHAYWVNWEKDSTEPHHNSDANDNRQPHHRVRIPFG